jgi:tetratricopeptide (TPR) repeat protein
MNFNVVVTDGFKKHAKGIAKKHRSLKSDLDKLIDSLEENPTQGEPLGKDCYKVRMAITSEVNPKKPDGYYGLGVSYTLNCQINKKDCKKGIQYLDKVLQMDAKYRRAYYNRAICKDKLGDSQGAIDDLDMQISLDNTDPDYYHNRAVIKLHLGDTSDACNDYRKSYELGETYSIKSQLITFVINRYRLRI